MKIGIVGAGIAGLASAVRMASRGYEVDVFEANSYPGGKLSQFEREGFRFDAGPSLFTMPQYVEELFEVAEVDIKDHFRYERLPVVCHYFWEDGTRLHAHAQAEHFAREVEEKIGVPGTLLEKALEDSRRKYEISGKIFLEKSLHRLDTWTNRKVAGAMLRIPAMDLFTTMNRVNERHLRHPKMVQLFNRFATYNGSNPYKAPGLLTIIPHFEHAVGAFIPRGGMHAITQAIFELAKTKGARFHFNSPVEEILVDKGRAFGLKVGGVSSPYDLVISNMDVFFAYRELLPHQKQPERILRQQKSTSAVIFYWGIRRTCPELNLHNIFFSQDYQQEFALLEAGKISDDPTVYVNITSKYCPEDAPPGMENWFVMVNAPFDRGQDWEELIRQTRRNTLRKLNRILNVDVESLIACEDLLDPRSIQQKTRSHLGALYGTSSNSRMSAFLRHPNFSNRIKNLYFVGGSVHPGGGIPLCLLSARIVDELILQTAG